MTDEQLIVDSLRDPRAFAEVFDRHGAAVYRYLARRFGSAGAEDMCSEAFARAFAGRARYDAARGPVRGWLFGFVANVAHEQRRREVRALRAHARARNGLREDPGWQEEADARLDAGSQSRVLARALACLSPRDRETLLLFAWADLSYEEIALAVGVPVGTVRSRINRARRQLVSRLGEQRLSSFPISASTDPEDTQCKI